MFFQDDTGRYWNLNQILYFAKVSARPTIFIEFMNGLTLELKDQDADRFLKVSKLWGDA